jgi:hypothetical protein
MPWSRDDDRMLKMGIFWGDTAEEVATMLSKDVSAVLDRAAELGLSIKRIAMLSAPQGQASGDAP